MDGPSSIESPEYRETQLFIYFPQRQSRILMPAAKGYSSESESHAANNHKPSLGLARTWRLACFIGCECPFYNNLHVVHFLFMRISWLTSSRLGGRTRTGFPREGFGVRRYSDSLLHLRILGLLDYRVQIASAIPSLRRARSIRSLLQDAIGRSVVDVHSISVGSKKREFYLA